MTQELFEFLLFHLVDNIKLYNLLCNAYPELEKKYIEKISFCQLFEIKKLKKFSERAGEHARIIIRYKKALPLRKAGAAKTI